MIIFSADKYRFCQYQHETLSYTHTHRIYTLFTNFFSKNMKIETNNQGKSSVTFFKQSTGITVSVPQSHKKVAFRLLFLKSLCIPAGTYSYSGPWRGGRIHMLKDPEPIRIQQERIQMRSGS